MKRIKTILTTSALLCAFGVCFRGVAADPQETRPNIIIFVADDMNWRDAGFAGNAKVKTPNLDDMAAKGVEFDNFFPASEETATSRFAILSGRNPLRTGLWSTGSARPDEVLLPRVLKQAGYQTAHFGKGNLGEGGAAPGPGDTTLIGMGFDKALWHYNTKGLDVQFHVDDSKEIIATKGDGTIATMSLALDYIRQQAQAPEPFFVQICVVAPHTCEFGQYAPEYQGHAGQMAAIDDAVGALRAELLKLGIAGKTVIWFTSGTSWLHTIIAARVPGVLEWPGRVKPAKTSMAAGQVDMVPTLLELAGAKAEKQPVFDGISLVPLLDGKMTERPQPLGFIRWKRVKGLKQKKDFDAALAKADFLKDTRGAWIDGKYKLIVGNQTPAGSEAGPLLYDMATDPDLKTNLADKELQRVQMMRQALDEWRMSVRASYDGKDKP
jgi:arylsulfatase A-like enzyme